MPPRIALVLALVLIAVLFVLDARRQRRVSFSMWLPTLWILYSGSRPLSYWFDPGASLGAPIDYTEGSAIDRAFLSVLIVLGLVVFYRRRRQLADLVKSNAWLLAFFAYLLISVLWSDYPDVSFKRWVRTTGDLLMAGVVVTEADPLEAIKTLLRRGACVLLPLSIVLIKYFPAIGVGYTEDGLQKMWMGVTTHKNVLGYLAMILGIATLNDILTTWRSKRVVIDALLLLMTLGLLAGSSSASSKTSWMGFALGVYLLMTYRLSARARSYKLVMPFLLLLSFATYVAVSDSFFEPAMKAVGRDATLTGRTDIWAAVLDIGPRDPVVGRGYGSFWIGNLSNDVWNRRGIYAHIQQSHNGYLDVYIELGALGLAVLAGVVLSSYRDIRLTRPGSFEYATLRKLFLGVILVHNVTESSFGRPTHLLWFLFLVFAAASPSVRPPRPASRAVGGDLGQQRPLRPLAHEVRSPR